MCHTRAQGGTASAGGMNRSGDSVRESRNYSVHVDPQITWFAALFTYISYAIVIAYGHTRDFFAALTGISRYAVSSH